MEENGRKRMEENERGGTVIGGEGVGTRATTAMARAKVCMLYQVKIVYDLYFVRSSLKALKCN